MQDIELSNFINYYQAVLNVSVEEQQRIDIHFSYEFGYLIAISTTKNGYSKNYFKCSIENYTKITDYLCEQFIREHKMAIAGIENNKLHIRNTYVELIRDVVDTNTLESSNQLVNLTFNKIDSGNHYFENDTRINEFEQIANLYKIYQLYIRNCPKDRIFDIYPFYSNGTFSIKVFSSNDTVFEYKINCSKENATKLTENIAQNFIDNHDLTISTMNYHTQYMFNKPTSSMDCKISNHVFNLIIPAYNNEKIVVKMHEKALEKVSNKQFVKNFYSTK